MSAGRTKEAVEVGSHNSYSRSQETILIKVYVWLYIYFFAEDLTMEKYREK